MNITTFLAIIIGYLLPGLLMIIWDFRNTITRKTTTEDYLEKPIFLKSFTIESVIVFILIWPLKLFIRR